MKKNIYNTPRVDIFQLVEKDAVLQSVSGSISKTTTIQAHHRSQSKEFFTDDNAEATKTYYNVWEE